MPEKAADIFLNQKLEAICSSLRKYNRLAVAFSGGVDSSFLLAMAAQTLPDKTGLVAVTAVSPVHPAHETKAAVSFARHHGIRHILIESGEMDSPGFVENPGNRCYVCKKIVFSSLLEAVEGLGIKHVVHGANLDDRTDYRPGMKAAEEMGVRAPLMEAGLTKSDIRSLSKAMGLLTWDRPSSGCLATRIPYGMPITIAKLRMVEAAETVLRDLGFSSCRVRHFDELAKIEVAPDELDRLLTASVRSVVVEKLRKIGFLYVCADMEGYGAGRLNRGL